jgi:hypothetical protein
MSTDAPLNTAVLFLVFNRPDTTRSVFEAIRQAQPARLYVAADGPRSGREGEADRVQEVRAIATAVDWPCEVRTLFRSENLGCKQAVEQGITWFFEHEEEGIILEDDCLPHASFFSYCEALLSQFRNDDRIMMISGFNPRYPHASSSEVFFSQNPSVWGWASWARVWRSHDRALSDWPNDQIRGLLSTFPDYVHRYLSNAWDRTKAGLIDTWDYQLTYTILANSGLCVKAKCNLITNIGTVGTHASRADHNHNISHGTFVASSFTPPTRILTDFAEDRWFFETRLRTPLLRRLGRRILRYWRS